MVADIASGPSLCRALSHAHLSKHRHYRLSHNLQHRVNNATTVAEYVPAPLSVDTQRLFLSFLRLLPLRYTQRHRRRQFSHHCCSTSTSPTGSIVDCYLAADTIAVLTVASPQAKFLTPLYLPLEVFIKSP